MFNSKFSGLLTVLLIIAIIGIIAVIGYFSWTMYNKYSLDAKAKDVANAFEEIAITNKKEQPEDEGERVEIGDVEGGSSIYGNQTSQAKTTKYNGYEVYGTISIPKIKIQYPILEKSTPSAIKVAIGYLTGAGVNKVGNTVLQGHNYKNGSFFSNLKKLSKGDKIYMTDTSGNKVTYEVYSVFETVPTDSSFYKRDTSGLREVTLSTCTDDGNNRTIVLAKEVK